MPSVSNESANAPHGDVLTNSMLTKLFRKEIVHLPSPFDGIKSIDEHISKLDTFFKLCTITDESEKIALLFESLSDPVKANLKMLYEFEDIQNNYDLIVTKLKHTYKVKESEVSRLMKILSLKQHEGQSSLEFIQKIRQNSAEHISHLDRDTREQFMIKVFIQGLRNKDCGTAIETLKPNTLEEAHKLIKKEDKIQKPNTEGCLAVENTSTDYRHLQRQIQDLENRLRSLEIKSMGPKRFMHSNNNKQLPKLICHHCKKEGHTSRFCKMRVVCYSCNKPGHLSRNCHNKKAAVRYVTNEYEPSNESQTYSEDDFDKEQYFHDNNEETNPTHQATCAAINTKHSKCAVIPPSRSRPKKPTLCEKYVQFINGNGSKPRQVLKKESDNTNNRYKLSDTKPIVSCRFNSVRGLVLVDSGASCNLITRSYLNRLSHNGSQINIQRSLVNKISCANDSHLTCHGEAVISFSIGGIVCPTNFLVVDHLMSGVDSILGIRSMKRMRISIRPTDDCVYVHNIAIPFERSIRSATTVVQINPEN